MVVTLSQQNQLWDTVLSIVKDRISDRHVFDSFLADSRVHKIDGNKIIVIVNSALAASLLKTNARYNEIIKDAIKIATESDYELELITNDDIKNLAEKPQPQKHQFFANSVLNPKYTFDNFVVGDCNREAVQAALLVTAAPGGSFNPNPLFIYSKSGLGKTHLLHAIGNYTKEKNPYSKVLYINTDTFIDEFIRYVRGDQESESLKDFFQTIDVLLVDDIQFLSDKSKTSEMFFHIFNTLINAGKQIVLTSDRHPNDLKGLEERLVSRFNMGLSVNIVNPDTSTLIEILKTKISSNGLSVADFDADGLAFLAENFNKNIRELEGALNRLIFYAINIKNNDRITLDIVKASAQPIIGSKKSNKVVTEDRIIETVADYYNLTEQQIKSKFRTSQIALARHISMYLCRQLCGTQFVKLGNIFGGRDHSTVMSAVEKVRINLKTDTQLATAINEIQKQLKS